MKLKFCARSWAYKDVKVQALAFECGISASVKRPVLMTKYGCIQIRSALGLQKREQWVF